MRYLLPALLLAFSPSFALAQRDAKTPDPDPELERKTFILPEGFEVNLFASDPLLAKPIQMNFDPRGRLWIASSEIYPQIKPGEKANDKIIILEDTDGDGKADKTTIFADGLLIPTGVEPGDGGAYVANSTELVHLSASKPGGKADKKKVLLSGFGTEDTHHIIHTFRWGPDCRLYFNQSIYIHSHIETPHGVKRLNAGGIWRFNPDKTELDIFARGWINSWGHAFDKYGQSFATDGANGEGINHVIVGGYYPTAQGPHTQRILHGLNPGSPKHCGLEIVSGRHFPPEWDGDCITCDFRGHRVCRFKLSDDGSSYASREMPEVIKSNHPAFRPIDVKMGPDGALYIADWYNPIIQHGEVDFRDPRRDKTHGRIWRVTAKNRKLVEKPKLVDATIPELLDQLKAPEQWTRQQAKRVLKERGAEKVLPELGKWTVKLDNRDEHAHLEAMWLLIALGEPIRLRDVEHLRSQSAKAAAVRGFTYTLTGTKPSNESDAITWETCRKHAEVDISSVGIVGGTDPRVRLEGVRALALLKSADAAGNAISILDKPMDRSLDYALWLTLRELEPYWMPEFKAGKLDFGGDAKKIAFALSAAANKDTVKPVVALIDGGKLPKENIHGMYLLLAQIGGTEELVKVLGYASRDSGITATQRAELTRAVEDAIRTRKVPPPKTVSSLGLLATEKAGAARHPAMRIIGLWKSKEHREIVETLATTEATIPADERGVALEALALFGDAEAKKLINAMCDAKHPDDVCRVAIIALASIDLPAAVDHAGRFFGYAKANPELADLFTAIVTRKGGPTMLAKAITGSRFNSPDVAKIGLKAVRASGQPADDLIAALTKAGDLAAARKPPTEAEVKDLTANAIKNGNAARGELVYRRKELQCLACHAYAGAGGLVGPDMTSIGASAQPDYLVDSLLLPSKAIKENFDVTRVVTKADRVISGIKLREADGKLVLRNEKDEEVTIPLDDIADRSKSTKSLMPDNLTDSLTKQEFADLVKFMSELGKVDGPFAPSKARVVRRWQLIEPTNANLNLFRRTRVSAATEPDNPFTWGSAYSKVSGDLPLAELPKYSVWNDTAALTVLRFQLDVTTAGSAKLKFNSVAGVAAYLGNTPFEAKAETVLELKSGVQTITLIIDRSKRTDDLRIELDDVKDSPAKLLVVGGK